jgi:hypothetical protein
MYATLHSSSLSEPSLSSPRSGGRWKPDPNPPKVDCDILGAGGRFDGPMSVAELPFVVLFCEAPLKSVFAGFSLLKPKPLKWFCTNRGVEGAAP